MEQLEQKIYDVMLIISNMQNKIEAIKFKLDVQEKLIRILGKQCEILEGRTQEKDDTDG